MIGPANISSTLADLITTTGSSDAGTFRHAAGAGSRLRGHDGYAGAAAARRGTRWGKPVSNNLGRRYDGGRAAVSNSGGIVRAAGPDMAGQCGGRAAETRRHADLSDPSRLAAEFRRASRGHFCDGACDGAILQHVDPNQ